MKFVSTAPHLIFILVDFLWQQMFSHFFNWFRQFRCYQTTKRRHKNEIWYRIINETQADIWFTGSHIIMQKVLRNECINKNELQVERVTLNGFSTTTTTEHTHTHMFAEPIVMLDTYNLTFDGNFFTFYRLYCNVNQHSVQKKKISSSLLTSHGSPSFLATSYKTNIYRTQNCVINRWLLRWIKWRWKWQMKCTIKTRIK